MSTLSANQLIGMAAACVQCGEEHEYRRACDCDCGGSAPWTWAARDGHAYRPRIGALLNGYAPEMIQTLRRILEAAEREGVE